MSVQSTRLELFIDVFDHIKQRALALPTVLSGELVSSILQEFREYDFLSDNPTEYQLLNVDNNSMVADEIPLNEQQIEKGQHLRFVEKERDVPEGAMRPSQPIYLRDMASGKVHKLHWLPAIIGRPDPEAPDNELLAVNLEPEQLGLRVSRRHARIVEEDGQFYVGSLSQNPTSIQDSEGNSAVIGRRWRLKDGDMLSLERSGINFKFIVRQPVPIAPAPIATEVDDPDTDATVVVPSKAT